MTTLQPYRSGLDLGRLINEMDAGDLIAAGAAVLAIVAAGIAFWQAISAKRSAKAAEEQVKAAKRQAVAAEKQVALMQDQAAQQVSDLAKKFEVFHESEHGIFNIMYRNASEHPVHDVNIYLSRAGKRIHRTVVGRLGPTNVPERLHPTSNEFAKALEPKAPRIATTQGLFKYEAAFPQDASITVVFRDDNGADWVRVGSRLIPAGNRDEALAHLDPPYREGEE